jgi:hypothetical protein
MDCGVDDVTAIHQHANDLCDTNHVHIKKTSLNLVHLAGFVPARGQHALTIRG